MPHLIHILLSGGYFIPNDASLRATYLSTSHLPQQHEPLEHLTVDKGNSEIPRDHEQKKVIDGKINAAAGVLFLVDDSKESLTVIGETHHRTIGGGLDSAHNHHVTFSTYAGGNPESDNEEDSIKVYLNEIGKIPLLTAQEEVELAQLVEKGWKAYYKLEATDTDDLSPAERRSLRKTMREGSDAKRHFVKANLRLVVSIARRYPTTPSVDLLDLIQEGNLGLEHAIDKFDWRKGFKFSTYATFGIRQAIKRAIQNQSTTIRLPGERYESLRAALRDCSGDEDQLDNEHKWLHQLTTPDSLSRDIYDQDDSELVDTIPSGSPGPEEEVLQKDEERIVIGLLDILDPRAKYAVEQRFGLNDGRKRSYREVGEELCVTAEAARRLVKRAVSAVRDQAGDAMDWA